MPILVRHSDTCDVVNVSNTKVVEAVIQNFIEHETLNVVLNKSVKLGMKWNGKLYEGHAAGMNFTSAGPSISRTSTTARG
jgi:hypothetical protein